MIESLRGCVESRFVGPRTSEKGEGKEVEEGDAGGSIVDEDRRSHRLLQPAEARMDFSHTLLTERNPLSGLRGARLINSCYIANRFLREARDDLKTYHDLFSEDTRNILKEAGRPVAGWFCTYTPVEILHAAGYTPVRMAGLRAPTGLADSLMHTNICPYMKACLDAAESGGLDFIDAAVFTSGCDAQRRLYDVWKRRYPARSAHMIATPKLNGPEHVARFAVELADLKRWLEDVSGAAVSDDTLEESIALYQNLRALLKEIDAMRGAKMNRVSGSRAMELLLSAQRMPPENAVAMLEEVITEAPPPAPEKDKGPIVLLYGNMMDEPGLVYALEKYGARVVADDLCAGRRFTDTGVTCEDTPPVERLADIYLKKRPCPRMSTTPDAADDLIQSVMETKPDGVVFHTLKFCDTHLYDVPRLRDALRDLDVKTLFLEMDYTPVSGQIDTRIQAFIEMLG